MKLFIIFTFLMVLSAAGSGQRFSNRGTDFWTGFGLHYGMESGTNTQQMVIYMSAEEKEAHVTITTMGESLDPLDSGVTLTVKNYTVPANSVIVSDYMPKFGKENCQMFGLPPSFGGKGSEGVFNKSIHIQSDVPIVAYGHISDGASSGATMLMPVESWGYSYTSLNIQQKIINADANKTLCSSWLFVVADHDNTLIEITPSVPLRNGAPANVPFTAVINKGQTYQVLAAPIGTSLTNGYELSGTKVKSIGNSAGQCFPVGVFTGSSLTAITCNGTNNGFGDNLIQQIVPIHAWGKTYLTAPFSSSNSASELNPCIYRVAVTDPSTVVRKNGSVLTGLVNNAYYEFISTTADYIVADKPILVAQYMPSQSSGTSVDPRCGYKGIGDPEMVYLSPIEQAINHLGFYRNTEAKIVLNYLTLIIPTAGLTSLKIDGSSAFSYTYPHPNLPGYSVVVQRWVASKAQCLVSSDSAFTCVAYGLGDYDSYAYNGGTMINNLNGTLSLHNQDGTPGAEHLFTCINSPVEISVLMSYQPTKLVWHLSQLTSLNPAAADITDNNPAAVATIEKKGITYYKYTLPGTYSFNQKGTFRFVVSSSHPSIANCNNTEDLLTDLEVKDINYAAAFKYTTGACLSDSVRFAWDKSYAGTNVIDRWRWTFPEGPVGTKDTATRVFSSYGTKNVNLKVTTPDGCSGDTTISIKIDPPAIVGIQASALEVCQGGTIDFTGVVTTPGTIAVDGWYWNFGNKQTSTLQSPQKIKYDTTGTVHVKLVGKLGAVCTTDTVSVVLLINPTPSAAFTYPAGCLPATGIVKFSDKASSLDGSAITGYTWNFGDVNATPANPNTSVLAEPEHNFQLGDYTILHSVTNQKGCTKDTTVKTSFSIAPTLQFTPLADICENGTKFLLNQASVTNGVPGTGYYKGTGVNALNYFTPSNAKSGTYTITYVYTTTGGCIDSAATTINVLPAPQAAFNVTEGICTNKDVTIEDKTIPGTGTLTSWSWTFGDGISEIRNNATQFTKTYALDGKDTISLVVTDSKGCISNKVLKIVTVHPLPSVGFDLPAVVCMPNGVAAFKSNATIKDNTPLTYEWNFGDGSSPSSDVNPLHAYSTEGTYNVTLRVTSSFGCEVLSDPEILSSFRNAPDAAFTSPDAVCQNASIAFEDISSPQSGTLSKWSWNFGDGSFSDITSPEKIFTTAGVKTVTLTVTNSEGCSATSAAKPIEVYLQPLIDAGLSFNVAQGTTVTFNPIVNSNSLTFQWTPADKLNNPGILRPSYVANENQQFFLTATSGANNCTATDSLMVRILLPVKIPNVFTPNGDGINDTWVITNLSTYSGCTLQVFNRYGQQVFISYGYASPWNGKVNGNALPVGVYYYIIDLKNGFGKITGSVTILK